MPAQEDKGGRYVPEAKGTEKQDKQGGWREAKGHWVDGASEEPPGVFIF